MLRMVCVSLASTHVYRAYLNSNVLLVYEAICTTTLVSSSVQFILTLPRRTECWCVWIAQLAVTIVKTALFALNVQLECWSMDNVLTNVLQNSILTTDYVYNACTVVSIVRTVILVTTVSTVTFIWALVLSFVRLVGWSVFQKYLLRFVYNVIELVRSVV